MQPGGQIAQCIAFENVSVLNFKWDRSRAQLLYQPLGVNMAPEEHGAIAPASALSVQFEDSLRNVGAFLCIFPIRNYVHWLGAKQQRIARAAIFLVSSGNQLLALETQTAARRRKAWIMANAGETAVENVLRRALIRRQVDDVLLLKPVKNADELRERRARGASKVIDRLVRIADCKYILLRSCQNASELDLGMVRVLKFIDQQETRFAPFAS